jgi:hypothetical protein
MFVEIRSRLPLLTIQVTLCSFGASPPVPARP